MTKRYCHGFLLTHDLSFVVLIHKDRPGLPWHDKLMGISGKVEEGETPHQAMIREFKEETAVTLFENDWHQFSILRGTNFDRDREGDVNSPFAVHSFYHVDALGDDLFRAALTVEREPIVKLAVDVALTNPELLYPNVTWLLPMAISLASERESRAEHFLITEQRL